MEPFAHKNNLDYVFIAKREKEKVSIRAINLIDFLRKLLLYKHPINNNDMKSTLA